VSEESNNDETGLIALSHIKRYEMREKIKLKNKDGFWKTKVKIAIEVRELEAHVEELESCNKVLAEVNLDNTGKIAGLEKKVEIAVETLEWYKLNTDRPFRARQTLSQLKGDQNENEM